MAYVYVHFVLSFLMVKLCICILPAIIPTAIIVLLHWYVKQKNMKMIHSVKTLPLSNTVQQNTKYHEQKYIKL